MSLQLLLLRWGEIFFLSRFEIRPLSSSERDELNVKKEELQSGHLKNKDEKEGKGFGKNINMKNKMKDDFAI